MDQHLSRHLDAHGSGPATVVHPSDGERYFACGVTYIIKACGPITSGAYTLIEIIVEPGGIAPLHRHAAFEEGIYVLEGKVDATLDGEICDAVTGSFLTIPWGLPHEIRNSADMPARLLLLSVPGGIEEYYRSACRTISDQRASEIFDIDVQRLTQVGLRFGVFA